MALLLDTKGNSFRVAKGMASNYKITFLFKIVLLQKYKDLIG